MKRRTTIMAVAAAIGIVGLSGAGMVSALSGAASPSDSLVERLAEKFELNKTDVQAVFDEEKAARQVERSAEMSKRLQEAVDGGDITAEQRKKIEAKQAELNDARQTQRDELEQWSEDNDIDERYLMGSMGMKGGHGMGGRF